MKSKLSLFKKHAAKPVKVTPPKRASPTKLALGLALSGAVASTAIVLAYRWQKHEQKATELESSTGALLLDKFMPEYEFHDTICVQVDATPRKIFSAFDQVTVDDMPPAWLLGTLRYLPAILTGTAQVKLPDAEPFAKQMTEIGSVTLAQEPDRELVIGMIGKMHQLGDQAMVPFKTAEEFVAFADPAYQKVAISLRVEPGILFGEYNLILEHRTRALSEESKQQFARYWLAIKPGGAFVTNLLLKAIKRRAERPMSEPITLPTSIPAEGKIAAAA